MDENHKLTSLIASIYDAALDPARWASVLAGIAEFTDGQTGALLVKDAVNDSVNAHWHAGVDPHYMQLYATTYSSLGPVAKSPLGAVEQILSVPELVPYDAFRRSRFYRDWPRRGERDGRRSDAAAHGAARAARAPRRAGRQGDRVPAGRGRDLRGCLRRP